MLNEQSMIAAGEFGTLLRTTDGGNSWEVHLQAAGIETHLNAVHFSDNNTGWVVGDQGVILFIGNGGSSWQLQNSGVKQDLQLHITRSSRRL